MRKVIDERLRDPRLRYGSHCCSTLYYTCGVFDTADWSHRGDYIAKHGVNPDPASKSGRGVRIIGYSITAQAILTVIVLDHEGTTIGVNAWKANSKDQRRYEGTETS